MLSAIVLTGTLSNCVPHPDPVPVKFEINVPGENLSALGQITRGLEDSYMPFGGDNGRNLFFVVSDNNVSNIYKKDNPLSESMSLKTSGKNVNVAPSYCAKTDRIVFASKQGGAPRKDIYMVNATGGNALEQVTITPDVDENYPCLSADGTLVVYEAKSAYGTDTETEIWLKNLTTKETINLGHGRMPSFSPDGRQIAFVRYTSDAAYTCLHIMDVTGNNSRQITSTDMGTVWHPRFSPDGRRIVFDCYKQETRNVDLFVIDTDGNHLTQLTINNSYDGQPYWSDDNYIYFASDRGGRANRYRIWRFKIGDITSLPPTTIGGTTGGTTTTQPPVTPPAAGAYHTVQQGETISQVAQKYGVTVRNIATWNNLESMTITPGMKLRVTKP